MIRGIYIAASAAISDEKRVDTIANNIANVNTTAYKKDTVISSSFPDVLMSKLGGFPDIDVLNKNAVTKPFEISEQNGQFTVSSSSGFFNIETPYGISSGRTICCKVDEKGYVVTPNGDYVLSNNGRIYAGTSSISVDDKGQISAEGNIVGTLKTINPPNCIGVIGGGVHIDSVNTYFTQGQLHPTENPYDAAIQGNGFFCIETPNGERYTRCGEFTKDSSGYLVTKDGFRVLGEKGYIKLNDGKIKISDSGEVSVDEVQIDKLKLIDFKDYKDLKKEGYGLFCPSEETEPETVTFSGLIRQGFIETSNVNSVREMVDMITMLRSYEANQRTIRTHDELLGKSVNELGRI